MGMDLIAEECNEVFEAHEEALITPDKLSTRHHLCKELVDLIYVIYQYAENWGFDLDCAFDAVHDSNMSKLDENGEPIRREDGKILKGPNYYEPDLTNYI